MSFYGVLAKQMKLVDLLSGVFTGGSVKVLQVVPDVAIRGGYREAHNACAVHQTGYFDYWTRQVMAIRSASCFAFHGYIIRTMRAKNTVFYWVWISAVIAVCYKIDIWEYQGNFTNCKW